MAWTNENKTITNCILPVNHIRAMIDAMEEVPYIDIACEMCPDNENRIQGIIATLTTKSGKKKEVFRALIGSSGMYLARYDSRLFE